ncbi:hypothetical protein TNCT_560191 [Trichonephila clavata]|uniref:Uncharacterized protein n=1 Tax=Trichonephila clavata TaxID=2740835 RepID=A0A8X6FJ35_TRICU|nr:hypothetical protein TNCT_560191 [Trichonephila clavata]
MTNRCIKCGDNHHTSDCPQKERSEIPHFINSNEDGHIASHRKCSKYPKPRKNDKQNEIKNTPLPPNTRPFTANVSFVRVCQNETNNQMATREEIATSSFKKPNKRERTPPSTETNFNICNFATYIAELQNLLNKFPEIFQGLEDMTKTQNDNEKLNIFLLAIAKCALKSKP